MSVIPEFHTEAVWEWFYRFTDKDPATGATSPRAEWPYDELVVIYSLPSGQEAGRATLADGTLTVVDSAARKVAVAIPPGDISRVPVSIKGEVLMNAEAFGRNTGGEWKALGHSAAYLRKGAKP